MKKHSILLITIVLMLPALCISQFVSPKELSALKKWKVSQVSFGLGIESDYFQTMSLDQLMTLAENPEEMHHDLGQFTESVETQTSGVAKYSRIALAPLDKSTGSYSDNQEFVIGVGFHADKEAMVTYQDQDRDTSIVFCNIQSEITLDGEYHLKGLWGKRFHWYAGGGLNAGYTHGNEMVVINGKYFGEDAHPSSQRQEDVKEYRYEAKPVFYSRAYVPFGVQVRVGKNVLLGVDQRIGVGIQKISGEQANFIRRTGSFAIGAKFNL